MTIGGGGFVTGLEFHPTEPGLLYARTDVGGAYRWDPAGRRWVALTDFVTAAENNLEGIESLALDPADPDRVYLAAGTYTADWSKPGAIFRSTDRGRTWQRADLPIKLGANDAGRSGGERLVVDPHDGRVLLFGSRADGLWRSDDRGATWSRVQSFPTIATDPEASSDSEFSQPLGITTLLFDPRSGQPGQPTPVVYAAVGTRRTSLFRSADGGATWQAVDGQPRGLRPNHLALTSSGELYVTYGDEPGPNTMTDGAVWRLDTPSGSWADISPVHPLDKDKFGYASLSVLGVGDTATVAVATLCRWTRGDEVFLSRDGGHTWHTLRFDAKRQPLATWDVSSAPYAGDLKPHWIGDVAVDPHQPDTAWLTTGFGIFRTDNLSAADRDTPTAWTFTCEGFEETVPRALVSPPAGAPLVSGIGDFDGFVHDDFSASPPAGRHSPHLGSDDSLDVAWQRPEYVVRAGYDAPFGAFSSDGGRTWRGFTGVPKGVKHGGFVAIGADGSAILWSPVGTGPLISRDCGASWQPVESLDEKSYPVADRARAQVFYALDGTRQRLLVSEDGGEHFIARNTQLPGAGQLVATPGRAGELWLAYERGLARSTDGGVTWTKRGGDLRALKVGLGAPLAGDALPAVYVVGSLDGVQGFFRSGDDGATWVRINDDAHQYGWINVITGDPRRPGRVYLGTGGRGIIYGDPAP